MMSIMDETKFCWNCGLACETDSKFCCKKCEETWERKSRPKNYRGIK